MSAYHAAGKRASTPAAGLRPGAIREYRPSRVEQLRKCGGSRWQFRFPLVARPNNTLLPARQFHRISTLFHDALSPINRDALTLLTVGLASGLVVGAGLRFYQKGHAHVLVTQRERNCKFVPVEAHSSDGMVRETGNRSARAILPSRPAANGIQAKLRVRPREVK